MKKCDDCFIGMMDYVYDRPQNVYEKEFISDSFKKRVKLKGHWPYHKFNTCPDCGTKIDWSKLDAKV